MIRMDEFSFINAIKQTTYKQSSLIKGVGDDAAVFRQSGQDIVTAADTFVENIHFSRDTMEPYHIGYRAIAANISDIAAMGSQPAFYLVSIVIPSHWSEQELKQIYSGMRSLANQYHMDLIGGDTVSGQELTISITVIGYVASGKARYRGAARAGDIVFATGTLGDSSAGFQMLTHPGDYKDKEFYITRHRMPTPRISFANSLETLSRVALNDISDGIANEAAEISESSGVSIVLDFTKLPVSRTYHQFSKEKQRAWQLFGGEDYELIGTVANKDWQFVKQAAAETQTSVTEIGYVSEQHNRLVYLQEANCCKPLEKRGYTHLKQVNQDE